MKYLKFEKKITSLRAAKAYRMKKNRLRIKIVFTSTYHLLPQPLDSL